MQYNQVHPHCGPFNSVDVLPPTDAIDKVCWDHDNAYADMQALGYTPYYGWNAADRVFQKKMLRLGPMAWGYVGLLNLKKLTPNDWSLPSNVGSKRIRAIEPNTPKRPRLDGSFEKKGEDPSVPESMVYLNKRSYKSRMRMSKRRRGASSRRIARIAKRVGSFGPPQDISHFNSGAITITGFNKVHYANLVFLTAAYLNDLMDTYKPYFVRDTIAAGAYDGTQELVQRDMSESALPQRDSRIRIDGAYNKHTFRNNSLYSGTVKLYLYKCTCVTNTTPGDYMDQNVDDKYHTSGNQLADLHGDYPTMYSSYIKEGWTKIGKVQTITLAPGEEFTYSYRVPAFTYDDANADHTYVVGSHCLLVRLVGGIMHDATTPTLVGTALMALDYTLNSRVKWRHINNDPLPGRFTGQNFDSVLNQDQVNPDIEVN